MCERCLERKEEYGKYDNILFIYFKNDVVNMFSIELVAEVRQDPAH